MMFFLGMGLGPTFALPFAVIPDAIEYNYLRIRERREGILYGIWTWAVKIGRALAIFIMGWVPGITGCVANAVPRTPRVELGIRLSPGPIAPSIFVPGAVFFVFYPINEKRCKETLVQIKEMEAGKRASPSRRAREVRLHQHAALAPPSFASPPFHLAVGRERLGRESNAETIESLYNCLFHSAICSRPPVLSGPLNKVL